MRGVEPSNVLTAIRGARHDSYDVVVIGGGIGRLTAGALLAHAGKSVLVIEADEKPAGTRMRRTAAATRSIVRSI